jgi:hypothetical protein
MIPSSVRSSERGKRHTLCEQGTLSAGEVAVLLSSLTSFVGSDSNGVRWLFLADVDKELEAIVSWLELGVRMPKTLLSLILISILYTKMVLMLTVLVSDELMTVVSQILKYYVTSFQHIRFSL